MRTCGGRCPEARRPFDLEAGPLYRYRVLTLGTDHHVFLQNLHHIVTDGWSSGVVNAELATAYTALAAGREPQQRLVLIRAHIKRPVVRHGNAYALTTPARKILETFGASGLDLDRLRAFDKPVLFGLGGKSSPDYYARMAKTERSGRRHPREAGGWLGEHGWARPTGSVARSPAAPATSRAR